MWIAFLKFVDKLLSPVHSNIHVAQEYLWQLASGTFPILINVNFTSLGQMTFICTCTNCNGELAYSVALGKIAVCGGLLKDIYSIFPWWPYNYVYSQCFKINLRLTSWVFYNRNAWGTCIIIHIKTWQKEAGPNLVCQQIISDTDSLHKKWIWFWTFATFNQCMIV